MKHKLFLHKCVSNSKPSIYELKMIVYTVQQNLTYQNEIDTVYKLFNYVALLAFISPFIEWRRMTPI